jgi:hypothetical protein
VTARANLEWGYKPANYSQNAENPRLAMLIWLVVSTMNFIFQNIWDNPSQLTNIFQDG